MKESDQNILTDKSNGRWTRKEHQQFLVGLQLYGRNWRKIQQLLGTRSGSQIRSHAQKFLLKLKKQSEDQVTHENIYDRLDSQENLTVNSKENSESQPRYDVSYFLEHIIRKCERTPTFDFWKQLIDSNNQKIPKGKQNNYSFVAYNTPCQNRIKQQQIRLI